VTAVRGPIFDTVMGRRILAVAAAVMLVLLVVIQVSSVRESRNLRIQLDQTYQHRILLDRLLSLHQDVETGQRGFTITGNPDFLQPYLRALPQIASTFAAVDRASANTGEGSDLAALKQLSAEKIAVSENVIAARRSGSDSGAARLVASGRGKRIMDRFRDEITRLRKIDDARQQRLVLSYSSSNFRTQLWTVILQLLLVGLLLLAFVAYVANLSRLRRLSAIAQDVSNRQVAIFNAAGDAMMVVDQAGCVESLNPAAEKLFQLDAGALIGKSVTEMFEGGTLYIEGFNERRQKRRDGGALSNLLGIRGDDSRFEAEIATSTVTLAEGARTLLLVRDATERNRIERMKNEFVSTVSHELRTPLTSIRGALSLLDHAIGKAMEDKPRQLLKIAKSNSERLSLLVDDILDIEKIGSGKFELDLHETDIREVVERAEEQNRTYAADRNVRLIVTSQPEPLMVVADESRLIQALTNLISNAAKFSPKAGVVSIIVERMDKAARISVADQGPGIPVEFRSRIFDRFAQAAGHESRRAGTGLGLAIAKAIIEQHKGSIEYETALGRGTRFWIDLPLAGKTR